MSTGEEDRIARSVALEKTYVHDVYDHMSALQYPEQRNTTPWPKVKKFLNDLEPGSIVCDVGCGNGKYLKVNPSIIKIGSDRCRKLTQIAKEDENEVLLCDNLTLPFRDESFDAVLSIAVIHHFATKERRVGALRELARLLRIGGRLMITVWAMEQKDRKFESQDVLVQWHHPQFYHSPSLEFSTTATATSDEEFVLPDHLSHCHVSNENSSSFFRSNSYRQNTRPGRSHLRLFQSLRSIKTSPSSSSLSSPNETCYSFVKKALQKLSRSSRKEKHHSPAWFLDSWTTTGKDDHLPVTRYDPEGCEQDSSVQDLPIELRRMGIEGDQSHNIKRISSRKFLNFKPDQKSKSLNDITCHIIYEDPLALTPITRSQSCFITRMRQLDLLEMSSLQPEVNEAKTLKPKLVKQKKSICEEHQHPDTDWDEERDKATDMKKLVKELPMFKISADKPERYNVLKQKSLTEDIMSADRLKEKESVQQNIHKQASLNEELIYRRQKVSDSAKDSFLITSSKKFQMFRSGLTNKLKSSTTNIEKVTGASLKSGFAKILQGLTGGESVLPVPVSPPAQSAHHGLRKSSSEDYSDECLIERRFSHEENSDSSKDNSLQSDTSIDSEDSIVSVIERVLPKGDCSTSPTMLNSPTPQSPKMMMAGVLSHPSSPKISQVMQYPNSKGKALSLPASPRTLVMSPSLKQTFKLPPVAQLSTNGSANIITNIISQNNKTTGAAASILLRANSNGIHSTLMPSIDDEPIIQLTPIKQIAAARLKAFGDKEMLLLSQKLTTLGTQEITEPRAIDICEGNDDSSKGVIEPISATTNQQAKKKKEEDTNGKDAPIKATCGTNKKAISSADGDSHQIKSIPTELFNPETEDIDTDSSGISTPDSVGSVISVKMDSLTEIPQSDLDSATSYSSIEVAENLKKHHYSLPSTKIYSQDPSIGTGITKTPTELAPKDGAILNFNFDEGSDSKRNMSQNESWDQECRQRIVDLAENLSERLLAEIDRYKEQNVSFESESSPHDTDVPIDPYLSRLSEDLSHVSKLTKELSSTLENETKAADTKRNNSLELTNNVSLSNDKYRETNPFKSDILSCQVNIEIPTIKDDKLNVAPDYSGEAESPGSISGWLDSRRNTIESNYWKSHASSTTTYSDKESLIIGTDTTRKSSITDTCYHTTLSVESTDTMDISERTASSSEDKRDPLQTEPSRGLSLDSDMCEIDKSIDTSKSIESSIAANSSSSGKQHSEGMKDSFSHTSLLHPGESIESSDAGDISDRTASVSDFSRQNTESRSVITQSSASLASWSDCSKDIRFADRRTARCDGRSSSEETNPRAILTRQQAAVQEPIENKITSTSTSLSGSTSQDSLTSESHGGSIMFHRYYHVFREGELDSLIDEFVENLHIISSYYDHTNWCIIAEKVRVWTI